MLNNAYIRLARLHYPMPICLLLFPSWWGLALSSPGFPSIFLLFLFGSGALIMRSAGCVYNDIIDQDLDRKVKRTALRPLANKELSSKKAIIFLILLLVLGAFILLNLPPRVILTGFLALGFVLIYPWMKQITYWPQIFLGLTFNMGILIGWLCLHPQFTSIPFFFYGGAIFWTIGYDTIYAFQDKEDDLLIGIKSSAIATSSFSKIFLYFVYGFSIILWSIGGKIANFAWIYWFFLSIIALHFFWQIFTLQENSTPNCLKRFESNTTIGLLMFIGIVFSQLIN